MVECSFIKLYSLDFSLFVFVYETLIYNTSFYSFLLWKYNIHVLIGVYGNIFAGKNITSFNSHVFIKYYLNAINSLSLLNNSLPSGKTTPHRPLIFNILMITYKNNGTALLDLIGIYSYFPVFFISSYINPLMPNGGLARIISYLSVIKFLILSSFYNPSNIYPEEINILDKAN